MKVKVQIHAIDFDRVVIKLDYKGRHKTARIINIGDLDEKTLYEILCMCYHDCDDEEILEEIYSSLKYKACNEDNLIAEHTFKFTIRKEHKIREGQTFYDDLFKRTENLLKKK